MINADVETTLDAWAADWSSHDVDHLLSLFTDDCLYEDVTFGVVNHGKAALKAFADGIFAAFPDLKIELTARFVAGDWAAMEWVISGTHKGDLHGMPATNKAFSIRGATIIELQLQKIRRNSDYWDLTSFLKQIDLMPSISGD
ncbi:MAG: ester cyclase [Stigonema ocellatum SAG 48.90 = DSM 106950]|nr:ester cyclase [Stigonema ocellatum SAG 48.90 = DSM 106950]